MCQSNPLFTYANERGSMTLISILSLLSALSAFLSCFLTSLASLIQCPASICCLNYIHRFQKYFELFSPYLFKKNILISNLINLKLEWTVQKYDPILIKIYFKKSLGANIKSADASFIICAIGSLCSLHKSKKAIG